MSTHWPDKSVGEGKFLPDWRVEDDQPKTLSETGQVFSEKRLSKRRLLINFKEGILGMDQQCIDKNEALHKFAPGGKNKTDSLYTSSKANLAQEVKSTTLSLSR